MQAEFILEIYTDGACRGNPGIGSWAAWLKCGKNEKKISGVEIHTTNNQMELRAPIEALRCLKQEVRQRINIYTDSEYVRKGISSWIYDWKKNDWGVAKKKKIKNLDLWKQLDKLNQQYKPNWHWVKGHNGDYGNELVDKLANQAIDFYLKKDTGE